jgi:hypothetical protein
MNIITISQNLNKLRELKSFTDILEIKFLSKANILLSVKAIRSSLDQVLLDIAYDLEKKIKTSENNEIKQSKVSKLELSDNLKKSFELAAEIDDQSFKDSLLEAIKFVLEYEKNPELGFYSGQNLADLKNLTLLIISEKFS